jgi:hypothetical protein
MTVTLNHNENTNPPHQMPPGPHNNAQFHSSSSNLTCNTQTAATHHLNPNTATHLNTSTAALSHPTSASKPSPQTKEILRLTERNLRLKEEENAMLQEAEILETFGMRPDFYELAYFKS